MNKEIKEQLEGKRLLLLGGSLWKDVIKKIADEYGITLIATGNSQKAGIFEIASEKYAVNSTNAEEMKKLIVLLVMMCSLAPVLRAADGCNQRLSPAEFRARQKAYITEKAGLTKEEAARFFPLYFELQDKKKEQNDKAWSLIRQGKDEKTTEAQYDVIMEGVYDARIAADRLDKTYFAKFKKILSAKKLYLVQKAEMRFHRELLKGMRHNDNKDKTSKPQPGKK